MFDDFSDVKCFQILNNPLAVDKISHHKIFLHAAKCALSRSRCINSGDEAAELHIVYKNIKQFNIKVEKLNILCEGRAGQEIGTCGARDIVQ